MNSTNNNNMNKNNNGVDSSNTRVGDTYTNKMNRVEVVVHDGNAIISGYSLL